MQRGAEPGRNANGCQSFLWTDVSIFGVERITCGVGMGTGTKKRTQRVLDPEMLGSAPSAIVLHPLTLHRLRFANSCS